MLKQVRLLLQIINVKNYYSDIYKLIKFFIFILGTTYVQQISCFGKVVLTPKRLQR